MRKALAALACTLTLASSLTSCGGGGGDSGPVTPAFRVSYDKSSLSFEQYEGIAAAFQTITGTAIGDPGGTIYASVVIEGDPIDPNGITFSFVGRQVLIGVQPRADLTPGTHTGRLTLNACPDPQCTRHFGGSPFVVSTAALVRRGLRVTPAQVNVAAASGQATRTRIDVQPTENFAFTAQADPGPPIVSLENVDATGFTLVTAPLPGGSYNGSVRVTSGPFDTVVPVTATVATSPNEHDLQLSAQAVSLGVGATGTTSQLITVTPPSWTAAVTATTAYTVGTAGWLTVTDLGNNSWRLTGNAATLSPATYVATVTFRSGFPSFPRDLQVTFVVGSGLVLPSLSLTASGDTTAGALADSTPVALAGGGAFSWTASTPTPWLRLDTASGTQGTPLAWHIDTAALGALDNFTSYQGVISVSTNLANVPPAAITITLAKQLPEVHAVAPYLVLRDRATRVLVRGRGFDGVLNLSNRLALTGVTPTAVTRINDTQLAVDLPAVSAAATTVRMNNALGLATGTGVLKTAPRTLYAYAALPTAGFAKSLLYDAERRALYFVAGTPQSVERNALTRLAFNGTTWSSTVLLTDGLYDVGLSVDGSTLFAAMLAGELRGLDPASNGETRPRTALRRTLTDDRAPILSQGLSVTADNRLWLPLDESPGSPTKVVAWFDIRTGSVTERLDLGGPFSLYRGPLFAVPRDGSRMLGRQNNGISGVPELQDAIKYDTATGLFSRTAAVRAPFDMRFTHDGRLAVIDFDRVVDRNESLHGLLRLPAAVQAAWVVVAAQITGDGQRTYLLAYPNVGAQEAATSGIKPRVYVFDSSTPSSSATGLPVLGFFELNDYPSSCVANTSCWVPLASALSFDDATLFFAGPLATLVVPIPSTLAPARASSSTPTRRAAHWNVALPE